MYFFISSRPSSLPTKKNADCDRKRTKWSIDCRLFRGGGLSKGVRSFYTWQLFQKPSVLLQDRKYIQAAIVVTSYSSLSIKADHYICSTGKAWQPCFKNPKGSQKGNLIVVLWKKVPLNHSTLHASDFFIIQEFGIESSLNMRYSPNQLLFQCMGKCLAHKYFTMLWNTSCTGLVKVSGAVILRWSTIGLATRLANSN